jgi:hypothetical protein
VASSAIFTSSSTVSVALRRSWHHAPPPFFFFFFFPFSSSLPLYFGFAWISASVSSGFWVFFAGFWFVGFFGWVVRVLVSVLGVSPVFWVFYGVFYCILGFMWALGVVGV